MKRKYKPVLILMREGTHGDGTKNLHRFMVTTDWKIYECMISLRLIEHSDRVYGWRRAGTLMEADPHKALRRWRKARKAEGYVEDQDPRCLGLEALV